jgi:hypothetical protein
MASRPWEKIIQEKRDVRTRLIHPYLAETIDDSTRERYESILGIGDVDILIPLLAAGDLTAKLVTQAYIRRCASLN